MGLMALYVKNEVLVRNFGNFSQFRLICWLKQIQRATLLRIGGYFLSANFNPA